MEYINALKEALQWLFANFPEVRFLLAHIVANLVVAVAASLYTGEFLLAKTGEFLYRKVLPYILIFGAFALLGDALDMRAITVAAFVGLETLLWGDLVDNLQKVGLKIPEPLGKQRR